jgi:hypothetical protein
LISPFDYLLKQKNQKKYLFCSTGMTTECAMQAPTGAVYTHILWDKIITDPKEAQLAFYGTRKDSYKLYTLPDRLHQPVNISLYYDITPIGGFIYRTQGPSVRHLLS